MQLMPATARWTAKKIGLPYTPAMITDRDTNLRLGTAYLKLVLDDFGGSQAMAAAAYNAGPGRPRRWREGPVLEPPSGPRTSRSPRRATTSRRCCRTPAYYAALLGGKRHDRPLAPRPADRPARPERAGDRQGPALSGAPASARIAVRRTCRLHASPVMHRNILVLGGTGFVGRSVCEKLVERARRRRRPDPRADAPSRAARQPAAAADGRGRGRRRARRRHAGAAAARHRRGDQPGRHPARQRGRVRARPRRACRARLAAACRRAGVRRVVHVSALGAAPDAPSPLPALQGARRGGAARSRRST